jgi:hypothetical protein
MSSANEEETFTVIQSVYGGTYLLSSTRGILEYNKELKIDDLGNINITHILIPEVGLEFIKLPTYNKIINQI